MKQILQSCACLLAGVWTALALAQPRPCSALPHEEQMYARVAGTCRDPAPIVDVAPKSSRPATVAVPNVAGLTWDEARAQLGRFTVRRSYRASEEPGGTVLSQQPAPPARLVAGATIRLVLSDGTLRPPPAVPASQIDGVSPSIVSEAARSDVSAQSTAPTPSAPSARTEQLQVPDVVGLPIGDARSQLSRFQLERTDRFSQAPAGRVIAQTPRASARIAPSQPVTVVVSRGPEPAVAVTETFELPSVVDRSFADASSALVEFKVNRVDVPSTAPGGRVLAQDPAPGAQVSAGSTVALRVSDGSLLDTSVPAAAAPPLVAYASPAPAAAAEPERGPADGLSNTMLTIGAAIFLALVVATLMFRQWLARRENELALEPTITASTPTEVAPVAVAAVAEPAPEIQFTARFDPGDVTIEFSGSSDAEHIEGILERTT